MKLAAGIAILATILGGIKADDTQSAPFQLKIASTVAGQPDRYAIPYRVSSCTPKVERVVLTIQRLVP
jgi:hypothetical protein